MVADPPPATVHEVVDREPGAEHVVGVDVGARLVSVARPPSTTGRPRARIRSGSGVVVVQGQQQYAVDVLPGEVVVEPSVALRGVREQQHQLQPGVAEGGPDAAHDTGEERLAEDPLLRLRDDQGDRVGPLGDQGAGRAVRHVAELCDRALDGLAGLLGDLAAAVDDAGRRAAADPGDGGHLFQGRPGPRLPRHGVSMSTLWWRPAGLPLSSEIGPAGRVLGSLVGAFPPESRAVTALVKTLGGIAPTPATPSRSANGSAGVGSTSR